MAERGTASGVKRAIEIWSRRKWLAAAVCLGVLAVTLGAIAALPSIYRARAIVLVDREPVPEAFVRSTVSGEVETRLQTIGQEVMGRERLEALVKRFDLYPELRRRGLQEAAVEQMRRDIQIEPRVAEQAGGRTAMVGFALSYRGRDPQTVADVTNALAALYVERNALLRERHAAGTASFLRAQLGDLKARLDEQERSIGHAPAPMEMDLATLERLNMRLRLNGDQQLRALDRRDRLMKEQAESRVPGGTEKGAAETPAMKLARLKAELAELRTRFTEKYPDVVRLKDEVAALEERVGPAPAVTSAASGRNPLAEVDAELRGLKDEERTLQSSIAAYEKRTEEGPRRQQEFQRQARDFTTTREFYQTLLKRYEDAQMAESMEQGQKSEQFRVLDAAVPPRDPLAPNRQRLIAIAVLLAIGLGAGAALVAERLDTSFHAIDDLRAFTRVPVLAGVPPLATPGDVARSRRRFGLAAVTLAVGLVVVGSASYMAARNDEQLTRTLSGTP